MNLLLILSLLINCLRLYSCKSLSVDKDITYDLDILYHEKWRPQYHFSTPTSWLNDPNGCIYKDGKWHLFFQYSPGTLNAASMHWGHATSKDLVYWENLPVAVFPDIDGAAFSGSAIIDSTNATGLMQEGDNDLMVIIFTRGTPSYSIQQRQFLAYSSDDVHFTVYDHNPILVDLAEVHFRDPQMIVYDDHWILSLAVGNFSRFYKSSDLINWEFMSGFGGDPMEGSHDGVWECPALMKYHIDGMELWILLISINPGGPNGGSATQYFIGTFNGTNFINRNPPERVLWMDWGPDNYAAALFANSPRPKPTIISWMNNWIYGQEQTTTPWRGQMSIPRTIDIVKVGQNDYQATTFPIEEILSLHGDILYYGQHKKGPLNITHSSEHYHLEAKIHSGNGTTFGQLVMKLSNGKTGEFVTMSLNGQAIEIDRSSSGAIANGGFSRLIQGSRVLSSSQLKVDLFFDSSAVELFFDKGLTALSYLTFPNEPYDMISFECNDCTIESIIMYQMNSIWK